MGGHGGLNILPQKRWHLYRDDNKSKVARDERILRQQNEKEARAKNRRRLHDSLTYLKRREDQQGFYSTHSSHGRIAEDKNASDSDDDSLNSRTKQPKRELDIAPSSSYTKTRAVPSIKSDNREHVNFFLAEEVALKKKQKEREEYLSSVGHFQLNKMNHQGKGAFSDAKIVSDFDRVSTKSLGTPWYMKKRAVEIDADEDARPPSSSTRLSIGVQSSDLYALKTQISGAEDFKMAMKKSERKTDDRNSPGRHESGRTSRREKKQRETSKSDSREKHRKEKARMKESKNLIHFREDRMRREAAEKNRAAAFLANTRS